MSLEERMARAGAHIAVSYTLIGATSVGLLAFGITGMWVEFAVTCVLWLIAALSAALAHSIQRDTLKIERLEGMLEEHMDCIANLRHILTATDGDGAK